MNCSTKVQEKRSRPEICKIDCIVNPIPSSDYPLPAKRPKYSLLNKEKISKEYEEFSLKA